MRSIRRSIEGVLGSQLHMNMLVGVATALVNSAIVAIAYHVYLQRLGFQGYGLWLLLTSVLTFVQLGSFGIGPALSKIVAEDWQQGDIPAICTHVKTAISIVSLSGLGLLVAVLWARVHLLASLHLPSADAAIARAYLPYVAIVSICAIIADTFTATLSGLGRFDLHSYLTTATTAVAAVVSIFLLGGNRDFGALLIGQATSYLFLPAATWLILRLKFGVRGLVTARYSRSSARRLISIGSSLCGASTLQLALNPLNKIVLSRYAGVAAVPVYELASNAAMRFRNLIESGVRALMPEVSRTNRDATANSTRMIARLHKRAVMRLLSGAGPMYICAIVLCPKALHLWLGARGATPELTLAFRIALAGTFMSLLGVPAFYVLLGIGTSRPLLIEKIIHCTASVTCACMLVLKFSSHVSATWLLVGTGTGMALSTGYLVLKCASVLRSNITHYENIYCDSDAQCETVSPGLH